MMTICSTLNAVLVPPWQSCYIDHHPKFLPFYNKISSLNTPKNPSLHHRIVQASSQDDPLSKQSQMGYDQAQELYGLDVDIPSRDAKSDASEPRSWFGPNGQYIRELPCPNCRGRGYTPCAECGIERSRKDCSLCSGKGIMTCQKCVGECVIWEESIDEIPWEKARSSSPLKVKEDDEVDNLDLKLEVRKKSKRVYRSTPEVGLKISRSLKSLNAKTGLFSNRMKIIHKDPELHAQRVAAIKKTKRTVAARKKASEALKTFFSDPENRRRRSISMKGTKFFCKNCGQEGHRSPYCPKHGKNLDRRLRCGLCGERGHNQKTCGRPKRSVLKHYHCRACGQLGHNRRTCSVKVEPEPADTLPVNGNSLNDSAIHDRCSLCGQEGHRSHDCPKHGKNVDKRRRCGLCGERGHNYRTCGRSSHPKQKVSQVGHNRRTCSVKVEPEPADTLPVNGNSLNDSASHDQHHYRCSLCGQEGHRSHDCPKHGKNRVRRHRCRLCGEQGHHQKTCGRPKHTVLLQYHCQACGQVGHNRRTCSVNVEPEPADTLPVNRNSLDDSASDDQHHYRCSLCGQLGHNNRTCPQISLIRVAVNASKKTRQPHHCRICGVAGHNSRSCFRKQL